MTIIILAAIALLCVAGMVCAVESITVQEPEPFARAIVAFLFAALLGSCL